MKLTITLDIPKQRVDDLLKGHAMRYSPWIHDWRENTDGTFTAKFDAKDDNEGDGNGKRTVGPIGVKRGLEKMAKGSPSHWSDFMAENDDDLTCDIAWQYILLGEVVYG